ncbi:NAD-dependent dehydratase [Natronococcus pandeyae]|uniref:NAD-dependent dehydratase n=1 Tax=Natronococcus pandeyae TaxID=2055836 RepID=A0A8J8PZB2_9EURY|nr:NAD-dependent dehydratase [Natronococcus pandeyae]TYL37220.1 NAD-dependent dehydratase [Natronococcus pandeyae]
MNVPGGVDCLLARKGTPTPSRSHNPALEPTFDDPREGDAEHTHADSSKPNALLGDEPTTNSREGAATCIDWYRATQAWYDPLVRKS